jgi:regulator of sigma E protease
MESFLSVLHTIGILFLVILIFNFVILVHEWGHFLAARWRGLRVDKFQIWFGKPLWKNGVQYGLGSIPLGGFVALPQMAPMESIEGRSDGTENREKLPSITPKDKIIVAFAGPLFSFLLAVVVAFIVWGVGKPQIAQEVDSRIGFVAKGRPADRAGLKPGDRILSINGNEVRGFMGARASVMWEVVSSETDNITLKVERNGQTLDLVANADTKSQPEFITWAEKPWYKKIMERPPMRKIGIGPFVEKFEVESVMENSPAALAGVKPGDILKKFRGEPIYSQGAYGEVIEEELEPLLKKEPKTKHALTRSLEFTVERKGEMVNISMIPRVPDAPQDANYPILGMEFKDPGRVDVYLTPWQQITDSVVTTFATLRKLLPSSDSKIGPSHMNSAVGIVDTYHQLFQIKDGWKLILWFSVLLNVNLAILNMLPFPVLDGGHITMAIGEMIRRKPPTGVILGYVQSACVLLLLSFMLWVVLKDVGGIADRVGEPKENEIKFYPPKS